MAASNTWKFLSQPPTISYYIYYQDPTSFLFTMSTTAHTTLPTALEVWPVLRPVLQPMLQPVRCCPHLKAYLAHESSYLFLC